MLRTTSQQITDSIGYESGAVGRPTALGTALDQLANPATIYAVPDGQMLLITHIVMQVDTYGNLLGPDLSPTLGSTVTGITVDDASGTSAYVVNVRGFARWNNTFRSGGTPNWLNAVPGNVMVWPLKYPVPVPPNWTVETSGLSGTFGNHAAVYGVSMDVNHARTLGFPTMSETPTTSQRFALVSKAGTVSATEILPGRAGQAIRILDIYIRFQPEVNAACSATIQQNDGSTTRTIFTVHNDNPSDFYDKHFSPDIFLKPGAGLELISSVATVVSVTASCEYVDASEVPGDHFWGQIIPDLPTPGTATVGTSSLQTAISSEITLYYPRRDSLGLTATATSPGKGYQHLVRGYQISMQKAATSQSLDSDPTEQTKLCLSSGSAGGNINLAATAVTQTNYQISPVLSGSGHDQSVQCVVDSINVPCPADTGSLWIDTLLYGTVVSTPTSTDADISGWSVTVWGRTIPTAWNTTPTNKGS